MIYDTHCHLDLYPDPYQIARATEKAGVTVIAVTNLPSAYFAAKPHMRNFRLLKLAIGLHPLLANDHSYREKQLFTKGLQEARCVGEVGLDFSKHGIATKEKQINSFRFVLSQLQDVGRYVSIHSRRAEVTVLELLVEYGVSPAIFHWYSGPKKLVDEIVNAGHYLSVNTSMIKSKSGREIINQIPRDRLLTETDGPFIKINNKPAVPIDVKMVHDFLAGLWNCDLKDVQIQLTGNFMQYSRLVTSQM